MKSDKQVVNYIGYIHHITQFRSDIKPSYAEMFSGNLEIHFAIQFLDIETLQVVDIYFITVMS